MRVYTDGACRKGVGGWGWWCEETEETNSGHEVPSTNQRMELYSALDAIDHHLEEEKLVIVSDSAYLVNCFRDRWFDRWRKNHWTKARGVPVANVDIWDPLITLVEDHQDVTFEWVKGHSGDIGNDHADRLASMVVVDLLTKRNNGEKIDHQLRLKHVNKF